MPLVYRTVGPVKLSSGKLELKGKSDSEFIAVNNETLVNILRQLASLVTHAGDIFSDMAVLTEQVSKRVRSVKLRLDELEAKADLFDPRLVPVPEGTLDDVSNCIKPHIRSELIFHSKLLTMDSRPRFMIQLYENAGAHQPVFPPRSPILASRRSLERRISLESRRPASFAALRDWKLDDYLDEKIATLDRKKQSAEELNRALASPFPSQVVQVDVTGAGFDRMKANRRSLVVHTKKIRRNKRRNTICGSMPNKECGIQTSFTSVASPGGTGDDEDGEHEHEGEERTHHRHHPHHKKYGIDSGHWSSCTSSAQGVPGVPSSTSAPSPWDPNSLSTSSDFLFDDEDRCLTPQLENFTDGLVSDSDSVDTDGYFTSFRSDCGFPRVKKTTSTKELEDMKDEATSLSSAGMLNTSSDANGMESPSSVENRMNLLQGSLLSPGSHGTSGASSANNTVVAANASSNNVENEYELFGKGSTSTTASSCGTVVLRSKPEPPARTISAAVVLDDQLVGESQRNSQNQSNCGSSSVNEDPSLEERVKRKSLIERVPSLVVVTPSPSCSSGSPPPLKDPGIVLHLECGEDSEHDSGRITPKAEDLFTTNESECGTLSDTDSDRRAEVRLSDIAIKKRSTSSTSSSTGTASTSNSTLTLTGCPLSNSSGLPQPDVIPDAVQQLQIIRTSKTTPKLDTNKEYFSLDTVLLGSFEEEHVGKMSQNSDEDANGLVPKTHPGKQSGNDGKKGAISSPSNNNSNSQPGGNLGVATSGKVRGARVVLDANGEIIFSSETLRRKRKQKVSFDPGSAVKSPDYDSNSTYSRVRESVYDRIRKDKNDPEKLYECIEEIRRHNLQPRDPFLDVNQLKLERNNKSVSNEMERCMSSASATSTSSSSSPSKSSSTPDHSKLLETDLDSAIPPVMPDLKNLPKIKDRLKRNESYRIANTDDAAAAAAAAAAGGKVNGIGGSSSSNSSTPTPTNRSPLSPLHLNRNGSAVKRLSLTSPPTTNGSTPLHLNKKRDIPEEDPNFIREMFSMNSAANNQLNSSLNNGGGNNHHNNQLGGLLRSPLESLSSRITLSKFTLSPDDRPSFLRRDSPPTMDDIAKEIYRFRKKFNIQPNASTTTLTRNQQVTTPGGGGSSGTGGNFSSPAGGSLRRPPSLAQEANITRPIPRSSSSIGHYGSSTLPPSVPRSATTSSIKSTIPVGFPKLSLEPSPPPTTTSSSAFNTSTPVRRPSSSCHISNPSPTASPIYYPSYGWTGPPPSTSSLSSTPLPPKCSTPIGTPERMMTQTLTSSRTVPPVPPTRAFGSGRKIFPMKPNPPTSVHFNGSSLSNSMNKEVTHPPQYYNQSATTNERLGYSMSSNNSTSNSPKSSSNSSNLYTRSIHLLPSLPFRRNSVALAHPASAPSSGSLKPRTSLGEFKRLLQATQKKRSSISAVEILKPKGLETTL
ncbi:unnamed protein product [Orchesella dallaii]|uniref:WASP family protein member n=1 Tax=Orchesella dallaii TaxID=48710 RepID=A0ABP1RSY4_9HEXA